MAKSSVVVLGIDLGKNSCSLVGLDATGAVVLRRRARRETVVGLTAKPACLPVWWRWRPAAVLITSAGCAAPGTRRPADVARVRPPLRADHFNRGGP